MKIGVTRGARGADVARLQRVLRSMDLPVDPREADEQVFGESTLEGPHALQRRRGLPVVDEIDSTTFDVLL